MYLPYPGHKNYNNMFKRTLYHKFIIQRAFYLIWNSSVLISTLFNDYILIMQAWKVKFIVHTFLLFFLFFNAFIIFILSIFFILISILTFLSIMVIIGIFNIKYMVYLIFINMIWWCSFPLCMIFHGICSYP